MILILEDDADREAYRYRSPFDPAFYIPGVRLPTVWISPEAYAQEAVLADLRAKIYALRSPVGAPSTLLWQPRNEAINAVLALIDEGQ